MNSADPQRDADTAAFYDTNAGPVYGYCLSLCADSEIAGNAFHRAMLRAWTSGRGRTRAFALVRAECRMRGLRTPAPAIDESDRDAAALARVFTRLPPRDAEVAELTLRFGLGPAELAEVFGLPEEHAERLTADARTLVVDALTAESEVGVSEGAVLGELVRSAHPLARIAGLMPPVEPPAGLRAAVLSDLRRFEPEECCAHRHGPGVLRPHVVGRPGPNRARTRRLAVRTAAVACSLLAVVGFVTALSRPSGVETVPAPPSRPVADPPRPSPPARVVPTSHAPRTRPAPRTAHRPARPAAKPSATPTTRHTRRHLSDRETARPRDWRDALNRLYEQWRRHHRDQLRHRAYDPSDRDDAPHDTRYHREDRDGRDYREP